MNIGNEDLSRLSPQGLRVLCRELRESVVELKLHLLAGALSELRLREALGAALVVLGHGHDVKPTADTCSMCGVVLDARKALKGGNGNGKLQKALSVWLATAIGQSQMRRTERGDAEDPWTGADRALSSFPNMPLPEDVGRRLEALLLCKKAVLAMKVHAEWDYLAAKEVHEEALAALAATGDGK